MSSKFKITETTTQGQKDNIECQHKPGEIWEEGCCTSRKNQSVEETVNIETSETEDVQNELSISKET